jgi:hypothetical protein
VAQPIPLPHERSRVGPALLCADLACAPSRAMVQVVESLSGSHVARDEYQAAGYHGTMQPCQVRLKTGRSALNTSTLQEYEGDMTMAEVSTIDQAKGDSMPRPYAPSWVDRFNAWVTRRPGPSWLYYLGIGLALFLVQIAVLWGEKAYPVGAIIPSHTFIAGIIPLLLWLCLHLDNRAEEALRTLRPAMKASEEEYARLRYEVTTLPARPALLASLAGVAFILLVNLLLGTSRGFDDLIDFPISKNVIYWIYVSSWWFIAAFLYHTIHQLRTTNLIYTKYTRVVLLRMTPLYALSSLTALTAVSLAAITYGWIALNPGLSAEPISWAIVVPITALAIAAFVWPLLGIHRLLVEEKGRLLDECSLRLEATIAELHRRVDSERLERMDDLNQTIASLGMELNLLEGVPTWPWQPETVRLLITALALPLGLWLAQLVLQRVMGP